MIPPYYLITLFILVLLLLFILFVLLWNRSPKNTHSNINNRNTDEAPSPKAPEIPIEIPDPPIEDGFKPFTLDYISDASKKERIFLLCLEHAFDKTVPLPSLDQARSIFPFIYGPRINFPDTFIANFLFSLTTSLDKMNNFLENSSKELLYSILDATPTPHFYKCELDSASRPSNSIDYTFPSVLSKFLEPEIFDVFKEQVDQDTLNLLIEIISSNRNEFIYITKKNELHKLLQRNSQRALLLKLCFVSFDGLDSLTFIQRFSEFLKLPRASPWIVNMKRLIVVNHAKDLALIIKKEKLLTREAVKALLQCSEANLKGSISALSEELRAEITRKYLNYYAQVRYSLDYIENSRDAENNNYILYYAAIFLKDSLDELSLKSNFHHFEPKGSKMNDALKVIKQSKFVNPNGEFYEEYYSHISGYCSPNRPLDFKVAIFNHKWANLFEKTRLIYDVVSVSKICELGHFDLDKLQDLVTVFKILPQENRMFTVDQVVLLKKIADMAKDCFAKYRVSGLDLDNMNSTLNWLLYSLVSDCVFFLKLKPTLDSLLLKDDLSDEVVIQSIQNGKITYPNIVHNESLFSEHTVEIMEYIAWKRKPEMFERRLELAFECIEVFLDNSQLISNI